MLKCELPSFLKRSLVLSMLSGGFVALLGLLLAPQRMWPNYLISVLYATGLGLGAGFFIATQYVSSAGWSVAIRRIPEAMISILPLAGIGALGLFFGIDRLYE